MTATAIETITLSHRLDQGRVPFPEALRYSTLLAEALRQFHDAGRITHLQPSNIVLTGSGLELHPEIEAGAITPYTAPEILQGRAADARSDIFAFGAIVYELITGRRAFAGDNADALAVSLTISVPPPTGLPAVDHLVGHCLAKDPAQRCSRMQKVILELKLLTFAETPVRQAPQVALRAETQQLESRIAVLLESHEEAIQHIHQANHAVGELREQVSTLRSALTSAEERSARAEQEHGEQVTTLRSVIAAAQERSARIEQEHGEQVSWLRAELGASQERSIRTAQEHGEQVSSLRADLAVSQERFARTEQEHAEQVSSLRADLAASQERSARAEQEHAEQVSSLRADLAAAQEHLARAEQEHADQLGALRAELAAAHERLSRAEQEHAEQVQHILAGVQQVEENVHTMDQGLAAGEGNLEVLSQRVTMLQEYQASRLQEIEQTIRSQSAEIALVSAGQAQTDDLVEGVVAAMEVLQSSVYDFGER